MGLARIELIGQPDSDLRTFKCPLCSGELTETVRHKYSNTPREDQ
jgi:hypothetical protein